MLPRNNIVAASDYGGRPRRSFRSCDNAADDRVAGHFFFIPKTRHTQTPFASRPCPVNKIPHPPQQNNKRFF